MKYKLSWRTPDLLLLEKLGFQDQHGEANYMLSYIPHMETMNTNRSRLQIWTVLNPTFPALQSPATPKMSNTFPKILSGLLLSLLLPETIEIVSFEPRGFVLAYATVGLSSDWRQLQAMGSTSCTFLLLRVELAKWSSLAEEDKTMFSLRISGSFVRRV